MVTKEKEGYLRIGKKYFKLRPIIYKPKKGEKYLTIGKKKFEMKPFILRPKRKK